MVVFFLPVALLCQVFMPVLFLIITTGNWFTKDGYGFTWLEFFEPTTAWYRGFLNAAENDRN
jgi:hypothetical protein